MIYLILSLALTASARPGEYIQNIQVRLENPHSQNLDQKLAESVLKSHATQTRGCAAQLIGKVDLKKSILHAPTWIGVMLNQVYMANIPLTLSDKEFLLHSRYLAPIGLEIGEDSLPTSLADLRKVFTRVQSNLNPYETSSGQIRPPKTIAVQVPFVDRNIAQIHVTLKYSKEETYSFDLTVTRAVDFIDDVHSMSEAIAKKILRLVKHQSLFDEKVFNHEANQLRYNIIKLAAFSPNEYDRTNLLKIAQSLNFENQIKFPSMISKMNSYLKLKMQFLTSVQSQAAGSQQFYKTSTPVGYSFYYPINNQLSTLLRTWLFEPEVLLDHPLFPQNQILPLQATVSLFTSLTDHPEKDFELIPEERSGDSSLVPLFTQDHHVIDPWNPRAATEKSLFVLDPKDGKFHPFHKEDQDRLSEYGQQL